MTHRHAIVVGGGIGGLAAARALSLNDWDVTLLEQAHAFAEVGAGLTLAPNAVRALEWLGLGEELKARRALHGPIGIRTASGRWLLRLPAERIVEEYGRAIYAFHRADLHQLLLNSVNKVDLRTGHRATHVSAESGTVHVTLERGSRMVTESADLVVAADGVHSNLRSGLCPDYPGASYAGYVCWRAIVPADVLKDVGLDGALTETWGRGLRFGIVSLGDGRGYWFACVLLPERKDRDDTLDEVAARFRAWHAPIPQLLRVTPPEVMIRNDIYYVSAPLGRFVHGRVALLGDAAHAVTPDIGQGACLAIEDAVVLAATLAGSTNLTAGLAAYDRVRRPRTQSMARLSGRLARVLQTRNPVAAGMRDLFASVLPTWAFLRASAGAFSWTPPARPERSSDR
jgi:2-polyprenyl-6-methoxyphenol hydroxylase-like FAD-dependent oxidoreductase